MAKTWRILVVDDRQADVIAQMVQGTRVLGEENPIEVVTCEVFDDALPILQNERIDLIVLDLKDDDQDTVSDGELAGERVFEAIKGALFLPVIFYTGLPGRVRHLANSFVEVLPRGGADQVRDSIKRIFSTQIPQLLRHLEEEKRRYMWGILLNHNEILSGTDSEEAAFLLARRMANVLEGSSVRRFLSGGDPSGDIDSSGIHPVEMYVYPSIDPDLLAGDIIKDGTEDDPEFWVVLTPSCDLVASRPKAERVLLAKCFQLEGQAEYSKALEKGDKHRFEPFKKLASNKGEKRQQDRFHFLPKTSFIPGFIVDFQVLDQADFKDISLENRVCSLDSPFAEALSAQFIRYYSRLGTPDLDIDKVIQTTFNSGAP